MRASAADPKQKVAVTFVSDRNYHQLGAPGSGSTVQSYDMKALATNVAAKVQQQGKEKLYFGTFYDPLTKRFGLGSAVATFLAKKHPCKMGFAAIQDTFAESGKAEELLEKYGLTHPHIIKTAKKILGR